MKQAKNGELWLSETSSLINVKNIIEPVAVWLQDSPCSSNYYQFYIKEILYNYEGRWRIRNIKLRHHHPSDYIQTSLPITQNIPILKVMLDVYYDDFGTFRTVYHSLGGIYLQFCNMPLHL